MKLLLLSNNCFAIFDAYFWAEAEVSSAQKKCTASYEQGWWSDHAGTVAKKNVGVLTSILTWSMETPSLSHVPDEWTSAVILFVYIRWDWDKDAFKEIKQISKSLTNITDMCNDI